MKLSVACQFSKVRGIVQKGERTARTADVDPSADVRWIHHAL